MAKYSPKDIFSGDEFGLFYNVVPDKTYTHSEEQAAQA
jgi:hypothetical protein